MKKSNIRICLCCGKEYNFCPNCSKGSTPWKVNFDTEVCKEIFNAVSAYNMKIMNEETVIKVLEKNNIKDISAYNADIVKVLKKVKEASFPTRVVKPEVKAEQPKSLADISDSHSVESRVNENRNAENRNNEANTNKRRLRFINNNNNN